MVLKYRTKLSGQKCNRLHMKSQIHLCSSPEFLQQRWGEALARKAAPLGNCIMKNLAHSHWSQDSADKGFFAYILTVLLWQVTSQDFTLSWKLWGWFILLHIQNISKRPLSGKTVWPWKAELRWWVICNGILSKLGLWVWGHCMHEPSLHNSNQHLSLIFDTVILCLGSCCSAGGPFWRSPLSHVL